MSERKFVVDAKDPGCYSTIGEAIAAAVEGDKVFIRPGEYTESLDVEKNLELLGDGTMEEIKIMDDGARPILFSRAPVLIVKNISFLNRSSAMNTVVCEAGILDLQHCGIEGGEYGLYARPSTRVSLEDSYVSACDMGGVYLKKCLTAAIDNSLIEKCGGPGITAEDCESLIVRHCTISDTSPHGITATGQHHFEVVDTEFASISKSAILDKDEAITGETERLWYRRRDTEEDEG